MSTNAVGNIPSRPFNEPISHSSLIRFNRDMRSPVTKLKSSAVSPEKSKAAMQNGRPSFYKETEKHPFSKFPDQNCLTDEFWTLAQQKKLLLQSYTIYKTDV